MSAMLLPPFYHNSAGGFCHASAAILPLIVPILPFHLVLPRFCHDYAAILPVFFLAAPRKKQLEKEQR